MNEALLSLPDGFTVHPKLQRLMDRRRVALDEGCTIEWAHAELLAIASILAEGIPVRLSGQDTERGTFSQRHLVLRDYHTGERYVPLQSLPQSRASFAVYNSPLTEAATLGFEYGYSTEAPEALTLWEAQFGDFANAGQVVIDQYLAAGSVKWHAQSALVLLLPHGLEGQGPEHSSARLERFLQLAAENNLWIVNCSTPAQYFHVLRLQGWTRGDRRRPLVVMTPKSLLRHPMASSTLADLAQGAFQPVLDDAGRRGEQTLVERLVFCSGKLAIDIDSAMASDPEEFAWLAVARVEQLYPFPTANLERAIANYPHLREVVWAQEEPRNMGGWSYIESRLCLLLPAGLSLSYIGRPERATPGEGTSQRHSREQSAVVRGILSRESLMTRRINKVREVE
jgi:2-oxoglutarate dehydrogenase E1 component